MPARVLGCLRAHAWRSGQPLIINENGRGNIIESVVHIIQAVLPSQGARLVHSIVPANLHSMGTKGSDKRDNIRDEFRIEIILDVYEPTLEAMLLCNFC